MTDKNSISLFSYIIAPPVAEKSNGNAQVTITGTYSDMLFLIV